MSQLANAMSKAALSLVSFVVPLALQGCWVFPVPGHRTDTGAAPGQVTPHITTRARLLEKAGEPDVRTPDERFFLYQNIGSRDWKVCGGLLDAHACGYVGTDHWARWEFIEFKENGVVKNEIVKDCENMVCGSAQAAFLTMLEEHYSPAVASQYRRALEQSDALSQAVKDRDVQAIKKLLEGGADPNARYAGGRTALHIAVSQGNTVLAEQLLASGADPNARDTDGVTPLLLVSEDDAEMIALLRAHGVHGAPDVNDIVGTWDGDGWSYSGQRVNVTYVFEANGAFVYDWIQTYGSGHVEQPPGTLHVNGKKLEYEDGEGLLWTFTLDEGKKGRQILHVQSKEGTWTLEKTD